MKNDSRLFDVSMGAYDGVEVCELVGTFIFYKLSLKYNKNDIGLYCDDSLVIFKNSGPKSEKVKKNSQKLFKENELVVTLNFENSTYCPCRKEK